MFDSQEQLEYDDGKRKSAYLKVGLVLAILIVAATSKRNLKVKTENLKDEKQKNWLV